MKLNFKSHLLRSELAFVVSHLDRDTPVWCVAEGKRLRIVARHGSMTIRSVVPMISEISQRLIFPCPSQVLNSISQKVKASSTSEVVLQPSRLLVAGFSVPLLFGRPPAWVFKEYKPYPYVAISGKALKNVLSSAIQFKSKWEEGKYSGQSIGIKVQDGLAKVRSMNSFYIFEDTATAISAGRFEAFVPSKYIQALLGIAVAPASPVSMCRKPEGALFTSGPRSLWIESCDYGPGTIEAVIEGKNFVPAFTVSASQMKNQIALTNLVSKYLTGVVNLKVADGVLYFDQLVDSNQYKIAESEMAALCWKPLVTSLSSSALLKFAKTAEGVITAKIASDFQGVLLQSGSKRLLITEVALNKAP